MRGGRGSLTRRQHARVSTVARSGARLVLSCCPPLGLRTGQKTERPAAAAIRTKVGRFPLTGPLPKAAPRSLARTTPHQRGATPGLALRADVERPMRRQVDRGPTPGHVGSDPFDIRARLL